MAWNTKCPVPDWYKSHVNYSLCSPLFYDLYGQYTFILDNNDITLLMYSTEPFPSYCLLFYDILNRYSVHIYINTLMFFTSLMKFHDVSKNVIYERSALISVYVLLASQAWIQWASYLWLSLGNFSMLCKLKLTMKDYVRKQCTCNVKWSAFAKPLLWKSRITYFFLCGCASVRARMSACVYVRGVHKSKRVISRV